MLQQCAVITTAARRPRVGEATDCYCVASVNLAERQDRSGQTLCVGSPAARALPFLSKHSLTGVHHHSDHFNAARSCRSVSRTLSLVAAAPVCKRSMAVRSLPSPEPPDPTRAARRRANCVLLATPLTTAGTAVWARAVRRRRKWSGTGRQPKCRTRVRPLRRRPTSLRQGNLEKAATCAVRTKKSRSRRGRPSTLRPSSSCPVGTVPLKHSFVPAGLAHNPNERRRAGCCCCCR